MNYYSCVASIKRYKVSGLIYPYPVAITFSGIKTHMRNLISPRGIQRTRHISMQAVCTVQTQFMLLQVPTPLGQQRKHGIRGLSKTSMHV